MIILFIVKVKILVLVKWLNEHPSSSSSQIMLTTEACDGYHILST
jgi:hypothetical protein